MTTQPWLFVVTQRVVENNTYPERRDALAQDWAGWFESALSPHQWVPAPNRPSVIRSWADRLQPDGLILSGGNDYGEEPDRDQTEHNLLTWFLERRRPVLGVCRGLHVVNCFYGGTVEPSSGNHVAVDHAVSFRTLDGRDVHRLSVNSFHDQQVSADHVGDHLEVIAMSDDGVVEGLRHKHDPVLAIQWHPERPHRSQKETDQVIIDFFQTHLVDDE